MTRDSAIQSFNHDLHVSNNQIFTYLNCSLKYRYQYVEKRPAERVSIALPFGSAVHAALEYFYTSAAKGEIVPVASVVERFATCIELDLEKIDVPVIYKKDTPDQKAAFEMGTAMLNAFYESVAPVVKDMAEIVAVELPLTARLYTADSEATNFMLAGILDLVLRYENGEIVVVDNKTAAKPMAQKTAEDDNQMTAYSYLLAANKYVFPTAPVRCQFQVLRKLKKTKVEYVETVRTAEQRKRFSKIANAVLAGIDAGIFMPQPSWMCGDCGYADACKSW